MQATCDKIKTLLEGSVSKEIRAIYNLGNSRYLPKVELPCLTISPINMVPENADNQRIRRWYEIEIRAIFDIRDGLNIVKHEMAISRDLMNVLDYIDSNGVYQTDCASYILLKNENLGVNWRITDVTSIDWSELQTARTEQTNTISAAITVRSYRIVNRPT